MYLMGLNAAQSQAGAIELTNLFVDVRGGAPSLRKETRLFTNRRRFQPRKL